MAFTAIMLQDTSRSPKRPYDEIFNDKLRADCIWAWEPPSITLRVAAQHSQFLFGRVVSDRMSSLALPKQDGATLLIAIQPDLKEICTEILKQVYDIRQETLFPDLDGFGIANGVASSPWGSYRW